MARIYLSPPELSGDELERLRETLQSNWIAPLGPQVDAFEQEISARLGVRHSLATSSGTAALHLALLVLGIGTGDEVWCSTLTFAASANAICYTGARPVFVDSDRLTWNMDPALLEEGLADAARRGTLPRAVIVVDLYGQTADLDPILTSCRRYEIPVIEDAAEALGATYRGRAAGSIGDLSILSFNGNKIITTSGGGMLLSQRSEWVDRARHLATQAREPATHYEHQVVGFNYRLSNLLAAVGRSQLADLDRRVAARRAINSRYRDELAGLPGWSFMPEADYGTSTFWLSCATINQRDAGYDRDSVINVLSMHDVEARPVWKPLHRQPVFNGTRCLRGAVADTLFATGICLPSGSSLRVPDQDRIIELVRSVHAGGTA